MLWFNPDKQHGFIRTEDGERLLVETAGLAPDCTMPLRCRGLAVSFDREERTPDVPRAVGVAVVPLEAPRRARRRGSR
jgi:cold shock CspA family protein